MSMSCEIVATVIFCCSKKASWLSASCGALIKPTFRISPRLRARKGREGVHHHHHHFGRIHDVHKIEANEVLQSTEAAIYQ